MDIDDVDFSILNVLRGHGAPMWKKKIHRHLTEGEAGLPNVRDVSVQTIGRRVDDLLERGLLESCIISPEEINRDLIIAFKVTPEGEAALTRKRERLLREHVLRSGVLSRGDREPQGDPGTIADLMAAELDLNEETADLLRACDSAELVTLLAIHYLKQGVSDLLTDESIPVLTDLALADETLAESLLSDVVDPEVRKEIERRLQENA